MMTEIKYYPVIGMDASDCEKQAMFPTTDGDTVRERHDIWLEEIVPRFFRLCTSVAADPEKVSEYRIHCPRCGQVLRRITSVTANTRPCLYACDKCSGSRTGAL